MPRISLKPLMFALSFPVALAACQADISNDGDDPPAFTKDEARALQGIAPNGDDICADEGWYDDLVCDDFCSEPDPDCPVSNCPDPNDPRVSYYAGPGDIACSQEIDFCAPDKVMFNSPECGCGCVEPEPVETCGGIAGTPCAEGYYCNYPIDSYCGGDDSLGTCEPIFDGGCPEIYAPVCGCDGVTYGNSCEASANGASIAHEGSCDDPGESCGGIAGVECPAGKFCNYTLEASCGYADDLGTCEDIPQGCREIYFPVCGCDGVTYGNECEANSYGVAIVAEGECELAER
ncbi:MAG: hypothetical protein HOW73_35235 [Polyangiaceae bacterium]|nr:hypothetical protein [Polyangiaceae bacterium]